MSAWAYKEERMFFRQFFGALAVRDVTSLSLRDDRVRLNFLRAIQWAYEQNVSDVQREVLVRLLPDPLTGSLHAFERALLETWHTVSAGPESARLFEYDGETTPERQQILDGMATKFLEDTR